MDQQKKQEIYDLLQTINEALRYLSQHKNEQVEADVKAARESITAFLEDEKKCSLEQQIEAGKLSDADWLQEMYRVLDDIEHPLAIKNYYDAEFAKLIEYIQKTDTVALVAKMKKTLEALKEESESVYCFFVEYFSTYPLWGSLAPEQGDYTVFDRRAKELKQRSYEFLWLYKRLEDYLSKRTLYAILLNWAFLDIDLVEKIKSPYADYYEPDIFPHNYKDVFVDVGAYNGDSISDYIRIYGRRYSKIFAYEISEKTCEVLRENMQKFHDVIVRQKGVGREHGSMSMVEGQDASANRVEKSKGTSEGTVEIVTLDEELEKEGVTFIKMDIEGAEQDALLGCQNILRNAKPKLAICTYHGHEDIWKVPAMIDAMNPEYKFYMRHYGSNLIPTEFVLLCK